MDRGPLPAVVLSAIEVAGRVADEQEVTVKNHRMRREPDPSTRNTRAERLPDPISGNLLDEDPPDAIERAIENAASPAPKAAPAAPHEPGSAQPAPDPAGLREAAQAALDEWDAATKDWMEWWARGGKGFHQFPVAAANHLRAALASEADLMHLAASPAPKAAPADPTAKPPFIYCPHCGGSWSEMAVVRAAIKKAAPAGLDVERRTPLASPDSLRLDPEDPESVACPRCGGPGAVAAHYGLCCDCIVPFDRECSPAGKAPSAALWGNR